jgi:hypothetical protein
MPKTKTQNKNKIPGFFGLSQLFGCFSAMRVQKHYKINFNKKSRGKHFTKNPKTFFFSRFVLIGFWAFLGEGSSKTPLQK